MTKYVCIFDFTGSRRVVSSEDGIFSFKDGFWITPDGRFTKGVDGKYWIPPSAIRYIEKTKGESD